MPKYRSLSAEELNSLEKEFVEYLILNGIYAEDWEKLKTASPEKADRIIDLFSDVVMEGVLRKIQFLEYRSKTKVHAFQCLPEKLIRVSLEAPAGSDVDFTNPAFIQQASVNPPEGLQVLSFEKEYDKPREEELFALTESGCQVSNGGLYKSLCLILAESNN